MSDAALRDPRASGEATRARLQDRIAADEPIPLLLVTVGGERFGLEVRAVQEALDGDLLDDLPSLPAGAIGVVRLRGVAHTVWSPADVLRAPLRRAGTVLLLRAPEAPVAIAVDAVDELRTVHGRAIRPLRGLRTDDGVVVGVVQVTPGLTTILDGARLVAIIRGHAAPE